jgi:AAA domain
MSPKAEGRKDTPKLKAFTGTNAPEVQHIDWLLPGLIARGAGTTINGQPGVSKTVHSAMICVALTLGRDFAGFAGNGKRSNVLIVDFEKGWNWTAAYFKSAYRGAGIEGLPENFHYFSPKTQACLQEGDNQFATLETMGLMIADYVKEHSIDLVIIDSLGQSFSGDQNSAQDVSLGFRMGLNPITTAGAAVLLIAHSTKRSMEGGTFAPTPAGSQQIRAWPVVSVSLEQEGEKTDSRIRWSVDKTNSVPFKPFITRLDFKSDFEGRLETITLEHEGLAGERGGEKVGGELTARKTILEALESGQKRRLELPGGGTIQRTLKQLVDSGEVIQPSRGVYALPESDEKSGIEDQAETPTDEPLSFVHPTTPLGDGWMDKASEPFNQNSDHGLTTLTKSEEPRATQLPVIEPTLTTPKRGRV